MTPTPESIARGLSEARQRVVLNLSGEWSNVPSGVSRQAVAALAWKFPRLCERQWQGGCAQCTYYRLADAGLEVKALLERSQK